MIDRFEVRLAGTGGQGIILAGVILAEAAALGAGMQVVQTQSYGPEARGGASKAEVIIASCAIDYPKVIQADLFLAMSQEACDQYGREVHPDGWLVVDSVHVKRTPAHTRTVGLPITQIAEVEIRRKITANILGLGIVVGLTQVVPHLFVTQAVERRVPAGTREPNVQALQTGLDLAHGIRGRHD